MGIYYLHPSDSVLSQDSVIYEFMCISNRNFSISIKYIITRHII